METVLRVPSSLAGLNKADMRYRTTAYQVYIQAAKAHNVSDRAAIAFGASQFFIGGAGTLNFGGWRSSNGELERCRETLLKMNADWNRHRDEEERKLAIVTEGNRLSLELVVQAERDAAREAELKKAQDRIDAGEEGKEGDGQEDGEDGRASSKKASKTSPSKIKPRRRVLHKIKPRRRVLQKTTTTTT